MNWLFLVTLWLLVSPAIAFLVAQFLKGGANFGIDEAREREEARDVVRIGGPALGRVRLYQCRVEGCPARLAAKEALAQNFHCGRHHASRVLASWPERRGVGR